jgi:hypothetical protein
MVEHLDNSCAFAFRSVAAITGTYGTWSTCLAMLESGLRSVTCWHETCIRKRKSIARRFDQGRPRNGHFLCPVVYSTHFQPFCFKWDNFHSCTVHFDIIKSFICPTNAYLNCFKMVKFTLKITINAPTCFGLTKPSSGSLRCVLRESYNIGVS